MEIMLIILALFGAFYYILLRPVLKQQRAQRREMADLTIGDQVLTTSNIFATVADIETPENGPIVLVLEMGPGVRVRALPQSIQQRVSPVHVAGKGG
ncbi:MAG: preprotein translocase subunit YajC [Dehalococcoidia bacterium]|nr:preprotein translocase subunit YajC [Dehalococcoidia bacterium]